MSSFIPSSKHFNSIEQSLISLTMSSEFYFPYSFKSRFPKLYNKRNYTQDCIDAEVRQIVDTLRELTAICVSLQYKHHYTGTLNSEIQGQIEILNHDKKSYNSLTKIGLYKALSCVGYQIEAEHLKELRDLTTEEENALFFVNEMQNTLSMDIVRNLPSYDSEMWNIN